MEEKEHQERRGVASAGAVVALALGGMFALGAVLSPDDDIAAAQPGLTATSASVAAPRFTSPSPDAAASTAAVATTSTAYRAAVRDGIADPDANDIARYSRLLADGVEACGEPESQVLREVEAAQTMLAHKGIRQSRATILGQLQGMGEFGVDCLTLLAVYVTGMGGT
ncbi:hypothetical protein MXD62_13095 [Frankia sp. Mgl5]|uniref:hypothetical protein n=1 Tax=Frankia sp. Mgl5 TaxID=2933793 RepID=UPI0020102C62|nr:hypothetical protein [Frankia sp. Mgl5]MCK9928097.1 hypothetical protein [Frankia sp. Mgl5]